MFNQKCCLLFIIFFSSFSEAKICRDLLNSASESSQHLSISTPNLEHQIKVLSGDLPMDEEGSLPGRYTDYQKERVRAYIFKSLESLGLNPEVKTYEYVKNSGSFGNPFLDLFFGWAAPPRESIIAHNLIVEIPGTEDPDSFFELTAHYDTTGENMPGADDNASGLATLLEAARIFSNNRPKKTIRLSFVDLEEFSMHLGSRFNAQELKEDPRDFIGSFIIDTIGYGPPNEKKPDVVLELGTKEMHIKKKAYSQSKKLIKYFLNSVPKKTKVKFKVETTGALPTTADHESYWTQGVPGILIAAPFEGDAINPHYHKSTDTFEFYNEDYFYSVVKAIIKATHKITF